MTDSLPTVSVLVMNLNGQAYLDACLSSLEMQAYPRDRFEVSVVDRGSTDGSLTFVRERFPRVRAVSVDAGQGLCVPYNAAVRGCESDLVALLNSDTRVDPRWLAELVSAADRHHASAVASRILDWTGQTTEFAGGLLSFIGHWWRVDFREPSAAACGEGPLLFPSAASALFSRAGFLDAGGFDEDFFAHLEDVDLGWRLNLLGHTVVLAPGALTYRRFHDTSSPPAGAQRVRLLERNALAMIYKNYEAATLARVLPAAVALSLLRSLIRSGIDTLELDLASRPEEVVNVGQPLAAHLIALEDFCRQLPALETKRQLIQGRRCRSDPELFSLFGEPFRLHESGGRYEEIARTLIRDLGIDEIVAPPRTTPSRRAGPADGDQGRDFDVRTERLPTSEPKVSIVILTALGPTHLAECLVSLREQRYPADRVEVIIVDNGSAEDPTEAALRGYPGARVVRNGTNRGFAGGNNIGASEATGDQLIFLNDDTRAHPDWLRELVETARRRDAAAVASRILDWSGERIDFAEGAVSFQGKGFQLHYGASTKSVTLEEQPLLFACGCAMLIDREVFADVGRWDEGAFAYYEDVELGWRLNLLGHAVWSAPRALVYHKHHGTSGRWAEPPRIRLYERNALRMLYGLLEARSLERVLPAALLLAADRALLNTRLSRVEDAGRRPMWKRFVRSTKALLRAQGIDRTTPIGQAIRHLGIRGFVRVARDLFVAPPGEPSSSHRAAYLIERGDIPSTFDAPFEALPINAAAMLAGIYGFLSDIPALSRRRADLQQRRQVTDQEILQRFGTYWLSPSPTLFQAEHDAVHATLVEAFGLANVISRASLDGVEQGAVAGTRKMHQS